MDYSFGSWIKRRRKALDLSQQDLARRVGCSVSAVFKIEADLRRPSRQIAELLAEHLDIPVEQRPLFLKVARREKMVENLEGLPVPLEPLAAPPDSNLPLALTPLVGREHELELVLQQLHEPHCRLLTLTGLGGVGKTRLALEASQQLREAFSDGVYFVSLAGISAPEFILPAIADALRFAFSGSGSQKVQLLNYLREKDVLLVLDNLEHLLAGVGLLAEILQQSRRVKFLVTSREQLHLQAEWSIEVQGLPVPHGAQENNLESSSAALLFLQRARQARLGFELAAEERPAVMRICQLVDGLPLGIELAAAWVRALSCQEIAREIENSLDFLKASARDIPERHRSLRAALDHSWNLLSSGEQAVFQRLSVFRGGFRREAAQEVAGASLEALTSLLDKSLLKRLGGERYELHELVRQYAAAQLQSEPPEQAQAQDRHSGYYAAQLERWEGEIRSPRQLDILAEMGAEMDNVRLAWSWMVARRQWTNIQKSLGSLWHFHEIGGRLQEGAALFGQAAAALQTADEAGTEREAGHSVVLGQVLAKQAYFCAHLGRYEQAGALLQQSLALLRSGTDGTALADTLAYLGYMQYRLGEFQKATQHTHESLALNRALANQVGIVSCLVILSFICLAQGMYEQAYELSSESLAICRDILGDPHGTADSLITLSAAASHLGNYDQAKRWAQESLQISRTVNDRCGIALALRQLGLISLDLGETVRAEALIRQSVSQARTIGDRTLMARALVDLGVVARAAGAHSESKAYFLEALRTSLDTQTIVIAVHALVEIAAIRMEEGAAETALELLAYSLQHPATNREVRERAERLRTELVAQLTPQQIEAVQARAQASTLESLAQV